MAKNDLSRRHNMKTKRKATAAPTGDIRALMTFKRLPPAHKTFLVTDNGCAPHLRKGEYAVVDTGDRELQHGEVYLLQWTSGARRRSILQTRSDHCNITGPGAADSLVWWVGKVRRLLSVNDPQVVAARKEGLVPVLGYLDDGPYEPDYLQSMLIGRIVGIALSPLGELIAQTAGWQDEAAGNAAFDPAEYVNALLAAGWRPVAFYRENGTVGYMEYTPAGKSERQKKSERQGKKEKQAENDVREKRCRASTGTERVMQECIRRGLVEGRSY